MLLRAGRKMGLASARGLASFGAQAIHPVQIPIPTLQRSASGATKSGADARARAAVSSGHLDAAAELLEARWVSAAALPALAREAATVDVCDKAFQDALSSAAVRALPELDGGQVRDLVEALADLDCYSVRYKDALAAHVRAHLTDYGGEDLGRILRAFGRMQYHDDDLLETVVAHVRALPEKFAPGDVANVSFAFSQCGYCHQGLLEVVRRAAERLADCRADEGVALSAVLDACARLQCNVPDLLEGLLGTCVREREHLRGAALARVARAAAAMGYEDDALLVPVLNALVPKMADVRAPDIVAMVSALSDAGVIHQLCLETVARKVVPSRIHEFAASELLALVHAFNQLGYYDNDFMTLMKKHRLGKLARV